ncbi:MAG: hypothetical protein IKQ87_10565 [Clostridia bacterium]|nr:hypothetical protein [Clostridia bacterium]
MNHPVRRAAAVLIAALTLLLSSCSARLVNLTYADGQMINKAKHLAYNAAPLNYEPASVGEEFAYYGKADIVLYEIVGLDPKEWLTEAYSGTATTVFYNEKITLPTLSEMNPSKVFVCINEEITHAISTVEDPDIIGKLVDLFENGEYAEWPLVGSIKTYELKFWSEKEYPYIYFNLTYGEFPEGKFLYDRTTKRSVMIGDLLDGYVW